MPEISTDELQPTLPQLRERIDALDVRILALLNERAAVSLEVGRTKRSDANAPVYRPEREEQVLTQLCELNAGPMTSDHVRGLWREIMSVSRSLQRAVRVACLGPVGTFSCLAAAAQLGRQMRYEPLPNIADVFRAVDAGECELGVVPLENSINGGVGQTLDLLLEYPEIHIQSECYYRVSHALLSTQTAHGDITTVYSHPQALAQCDLWLRTNMPHATAVAVAQGTAAAAQKAADTPHSGAIGHSGLGELYGLNILARGIEDLPNNRTRFIVISRHNNDFDGDEKTTLTSIIFTLPDRPGALAHVLAPLAAMSVNMKKLESRPLKSEPWKYAFFVDMECNIAAPQWSALQTALQAQCKSLRILGTYPPGQLLPQTEN